MYNVKFIYLYRDGGNYKKWGHVVFRNPDELSCDFITKAMREAFMQDRLFIAHQIRVPDSFLYTRGEANSDDHCYHEFDKVQRTVDAPSDKYERAMSEFLTEVRKQGTKGWKTFDPHEALRH